MSSIASLGLISGMYSPHPPGVFIVHFDNFQSHPSPLEFTNDGIFHLSRMDKKNTLEPPFTFEKKVNISWVFLGGNHSNGFPDLKQRDIISFLGFFYLFDKKVGSWV